MNVKLYACGGAGTNIARQIPNLDMDLVFVDTSSSNLKQIKHGEVFLVDGMDGAGKHRPETYENFKTVAEDVLVSHKPSDILNIVIHSISGGSGSVVGPMIASKLVASGQNTVVIAVESDQSIRELDNGIKTLKTYAAQASKVVQKPISIYYVGGMTRPEADRVALQFIHLLTLLVTKKFTEEFDNSDLKSFLYFDRVTDNPPSVAIIELRENDTIVPEKGTSVVGTILMTSDKTSTIHPVLPEYMATCVVTDSEYSNPDIRINSVLGKLSLIIEELDRRLQSQNDSKKVNKVREVTVETDNDDGMCL